MCIVHLHYTPTHKASVEASQRASDSFTIRNWNVKLVAGFTPNDIDEMPFLLENGRTHTLLKENNKKILTKLAILKTHIRFWNMVKDSNEIQIFAEHDVMCVRDKFKLPEFQDVLALHMDTSNMWYQAHYVMGDDNIADYQLKTGIHNIPEDFPWRYNYNTIYKDSIIMPSAACYALTPQGATKLLDQVEEYGAEQGDMLINTKVVDIKYIAPALITQYCPITQSNPQ